MDELLSWFEAHGGWVDRTVMGLKDIPGQGRGAVGLKCISKDTTLFTLPRDLTLSMRTSTLPKLFTPAAWKCLKLDKGWVGLILCMMWEESRGMESKWSGYLDTLPKTFETPMFWSAEKLKELRGTAIYDKVGRDDAEKDYQCVLLPAIKTRPDLFDPAHFNTHYSLENYHRMGSRILSRSFHVETWTGEDDGAENGADGNEGELNVDAEGTEASNSSAMDIDAELNPEEKIADELDESDDEDAEDPEDVAMVPMADMLNARYGCGNAKLFYEPTELKMITTQAIGTGEQIYNTYGDPPNSDLLRRYGHVDVLSLPDSPNVFNPADIVEIPADVVVRCAQGSEGGYSQARVDWWLEEGGDDIFELDMSTPVPDALVSFTKLLYLPSADWEKAHDKGKPPKPKLDVATIEVLQKVIVERLQTYPTSLMDDEGRLALGQHSLSTNLWNALIVRIGEKRILECCQKELAAARMRLEEEPNGKPKNKSSEVTGKKRQSDDGEPSGNKRRR